MADPTRDSLPTDDQRRLLCDLIAVALVDLRAEETQRGRDLAYALHNLPKTMWGWGTWSVDGQRASLAHFQSRHPGGPDYVAMFDAIFAPRRWRINPEEAKRRAEALAMAYARAASPSVPFRSAHAAPVRGAAASASTKVPVEWSVSLHWSRPGEVIDGPLLVTVNIETEVVTVLG